MVAGSRFPKVRSWIFFFFLLLSRSLCSTLTSYCTYTTGDSTWNCHENDYEFPMKLPMIYPKNSKISWVLYPWNLCNAKLSWKCDLKMYFMAHETTPWITFDVSWNHHRYPTQLPQKIWCFYHKVNDFIKFFCLATLL